MAELPQDLQNRFVMYLNILPIFDQVGLYALLIGGALLLIIAVGQAATKLSVSTSSKRKISKTSKYANNIHQNSNLYRKCEEKLICGGGGDDNVIHINDDEDCVDGGGRIQELMIIRRSSRESEPLRYTLDDEPGSSESSEDSDSMLSDEPSTSSSAQELAILQSKRVSMRIIFERAVSNKHLHIRARVARATNKTNNFFADLVALALSVFAVLFCCS
jgi:hypothetical protein